MQRTAVIGQKSNLLIQHPVCHQILKEGKQADGNTACDGISAATLSSLILPFCGKYSFDIKILYFDKSKSDFLFRPYSCCRSKHDVLFTINILLLIFRGKPFLNIF